MSSIDCNLVERKVAFLLKELSYLKGYEGVELSGDPDITRQYAFCHSLQNAIAAITDIPVANEFSRFCKSFAPPLSS